MGLGRASNCTPPDFPLPKFGPAKLTVRDFGAKADGVTNDTAAITFKDVDVRFEKPDARPLFSVSDVNGLELDGLNSRNSPSAKTLRIEKIENFTVRRSPKLRDRSGENVASLLTE
jgi:hypothetical protein